MSAAGTAAAGKAAKREAEANEVLALAQARELRDDTLDELWRHGIEARYEVGTEEAVASAAGVALDYGSAGDILGERLQRHTRKTLAIYDNGVRGSRQLRNSAAVYRAQGQARSQAASLSAAGQGLAGVGQALSFATQAHNAGLITLPGAG